MDIGIRELKAKLSEVLDLAEGGEVIQVTDRGRPKVLIMPLPELVDLDARIAQGIEQGWIRRPKQHDGRRPRVTPVAARRSIARILDEDRA
jgi:prevent-host-death family protein